MSKLSTEETLKSLDAAVSRFKALDFAQWSNNRTRTIEKLQEISRSLEAVNTGSAIGKTTGGTAQVTGGILTIVGICTLNPVLAFWGIGTAVSGGVTSLTSSGVNYVWKRSSSKDIKKMLDEDARLTREICKACGDLCNELEKVANNLTFWDDFKNIMGGTKTIGLSTATSINLVNKASLFNLLKQGLAAPQTEGQLGKIILEDGTIFGQVLFEAGSVAARALEVTLAGFNIVFGLVDIIWGIKDIAKGSELTKQINDNVASLKKTKKDITSTYNLFSTRL